MNRKEVDTLERLGDALRHRVIGKGGDDTDLGLVELIPKAVAAIRSERKALLAKALTAAASVEMVKAEQGRCAACIKAIVEAVQQ